LGIIEDLPSVVFQDRDPSKEELNELHIALEDDLFAPLLTRVNWKHRKLE